MIPCDFRSEETRTIEHGCCAGKRVWPVFNCSVHGECVISPLTKNASESHGALPACVFCKERLVDGAVVPLGILPEEKTKVRIPMKRVGHPKDHYTPGNTFDKLIKLQGNGLAKAFPDPFLNYEQWDIPNELLAGNHKFNCGIIKHEGINYLAYRAYPKGIYIVETDDRWIPVSLEASKRLVIPVCEKNITNSEDPRLWIFNGRLFVSYTGYSMGKRTTCSMGVSELEGKETIYSYWPKLETANTWEKNWVFFEQDDWRTGLGNNLYVLYQSNPLTVYRILPTGDMQLVANSEWQSPYRFGVIRGGAPPVFYKGEWYHWFHSVMFVGSKKVYTTGLYTFTADFKISRCCVRPLYIPAEKESCNRVDPVNLMVSFPGGAVLNGSRWEVAMGINDCMNRIVSYDIETIEKELVPVE